MEPLILITLDDFNNFCQEFDKLYKESDNYIECIVNEGFIFKYLEMQHDLLVQLQRFHVNVSEVNEQMLESEWLDIRSIIFYEDLENKYKNMYAYYRKNPTEKVKHELEQLENFQHELINKANAAIKRMNGRVEYSNRMEKGLITTNIVQNNAEILDLEKLENLSLIEKINSLKKALRHIESLNGEKTPILVDDKEILIPINLVPIYLQYHEMLNNYKKLKDEEIDKLIRLTSQIYYEDLAKNIANQLANRVVYEEYLTLKEEMQKIDQQFCWLKNRAIHISKFRTIKVTIGHKKEKIIILKEDMENEVILGNVMIDCGDEKKLQKFYSELLGWEMCELFARPAVRSSAGIVFLFIEEAEYIRPTWPEETGKQQKQMHFDFQVDNVTEMVEKAERLGAAKSKAQFGGSDFVTMFDPAGHPFCLCQK